VPDARKHRGADPRDARDFAEDRWPALREAVSDLSWLLGRGYAEVSSRKLVGDRYALTERQRKAVLRCACSDDALARRAARRRAPADLRGRPLLVDGFNVLTTVEAALGGAVVVAGRDGSYRDIAGVHGTYRKVEETHPAILLVGEVLGSLEAGPCLWYLDRPVSNSGRLRGLLMEVASMQGRDWSVELVYNPDPILAASDEVVATADSAILDRCSAWFPLARFVIEEGVPTARVVALGTGDGGAPTGGLQDPNPPM
jgi:hypothetical protein